MGAGATAWNSRQSFTSVQAGSTYLDLNIFDNNSIGPNLGEATVWNQGNGGSPCYLHRSANCSAVCYNTSRIYYTDIKLSNNNIGGAGTDWASTWGLSTQAAIDLVTKMVVSHEVGHVFGLTNWDPGAQNCTDPTIMSVFDMFYCQLSGGPTSCDASNVSTVYSGWSTVSFATCGVCNLSTNCPN